MLNQNIKDFYDEIKNNKSLQEEFENADISFRNELEDFLNFLPNEADEDEKIEFFKENFIPIANKYGININIDDILEHEKTLMELFSEDSDELKSEFVDYLGYDMCLIYGVGEENISKLCISFGINIL